MAISAPSKARASESVARSASTIAAPSGTGLRLPRRTTARTSQPSASSASTVCQPTNPVAPVTLTNSLFIEPVRLVARRAGRLDARVDQIVVLERPSQLGPEITLPRSSLHPFRDEQRIQPEAAGARHHAQHEHACAVDDPFAPQKMNDAEREQVAAHALENLVEI